ncbi:MAG: hypothetical protein KKC75_05345 [Nanoarchaeota archaeon]|nr:hypothetical protein [Nanoarchaeota archaeon]MBU1005177.1 hypothetical protein [Nanoarchaeota archaeon]MBU1946805.1 hypothetical protein [Nanoarchaeota archaeon]
MVQNSLVNYIREQIRAGYDINTIKAYLLKYGYNETQVNEAIQYAYPPTEVKHVAHFSKTTIAIAAAVVCSLLIISGALFIYLKPGNVPSQLLDLKTEIVGSSVNIGDKLRFTVELVNLGKELRYDVQLRYEVYNLKDEIITSKGETIALQTKASSSVGIELPDVGEGSYYVKTTASYSGGSARATSRFSVVKPSSSVPTTTNPTIPAVPTTPSTPSTPSKKCPFSCDDSNACTTDYCNDGTSYLCRHDMIYPCCGNGICEDNENYERCLADCEAPKGQEETMFEGKTIWEKIDIIKDIAKRDKASALRYCREIEQITYKYDCLTNVGGVTGDESICSEIDDDIEKDDCYKDVAKESKRSEVCANIVKESKSDQCYMDFATKGDYSVCDKVVNKYLKQSCDSLKQLAEMRANLQPDLSFVYA